jgi:hypothetical protein
VPAYDLMNRFLVLSVVALGRTNRFVGEHKNYVQTGDEVVAAAAAAAVQVKPVPDTGPQNWSLGILLREMWTCKK